MGSTLKTIEMIDVKQLTTPVPPLKEQVEISNYIKAQKNKFEGTIEAVNQQIEKLQEYRQVMTAEAVTGKIKI